MEQGTPRALTGTATHMAIPMGMLTVTPTATLMCTIILLVSLMAGLSAGSAAASVEAASIVEGSPGPALGMAVSDMAVSDMAAVGMAAVEATGDGSPNLTPSARDQCRGLMLGSSPAERLEMA
jgi:hypothetical protein